MVEGKIWGASVGCLVDTGATINILSLTWWSKHGRGGHLIPSTEQVYAVDGRPMKLHGRLVVEITLGTEQWPVAFEVADVSAEAILGSTFLRESRFLVDLAAEQLLGARTENSGVEDQVCRVVSRRTAVVAPGEEAIIEGYVIGPWTGEQGLVEGLRDVEDKRGILIGRGLVDPREESTPIRVFNPGTTAVVVYRDMELATVEPVCSPPEEEEGEIQHCRVVEKEGAPWQEEHGDRSDEVMH